MINEKQKLLSRLLKGRIITQDNCWLYRGFSGVLKKEIYVNGQNRLVHRVSAFIHLDFDLFSQELICHKCRTKYCWNPDHIYIGNTSSNTRDSIKDGTFRNPNTNKEFCDNGHKLSGLNLYIWKDRKTKQIHRWCKACRKEAGKRYKERS